MTHPKDIESIRTMLPNISADVIEKQKILQPGNCVGFGGAFKLPMVIKMEMPNPAPNSNSCNVNECWKVQGTTGNNPVPVSNNNQTSTNYPNTVQSPNPMPPGVPNQNNISPNINVQGVVSNNQTLPNNTQNPKTTFFQTDQIN